MKDVKGPVLLFIGDGDQERTKTKVDNSEPRAHGSYTAADGRTRAVLILAHPRDDYYYYYYYYCGVLSRPMASSRNLGLFTTNQHRVVSPLFPSALRDARKLSSKVASSRAKKPVAPSNLASRFVVRDALLDMQGESLV